MLNEDWHIKNNRHGLHVTSMHIGSSATAAEDCSTRAVDDRRATEEDGGAAVDITVAADISVFVTAGNELEQQATSTVVVELLLVVIV